MTRRVVITGMGGVTAFGESWQAVSAEALRRENADAHNARVGQIWRWSAYATRRPHRRCSPCRALLTRKRIRAMGRVSLMSRPRASELAGAGRD